MSPASLARWPNCPKTPAAQRSTSPTLRRSSSWPLTSATSTTSYNTAGDSVTLAPVADLTPEMITGFFQTRFVGALTAVRVFAPRLTADGSITLTSGHAAEKPQFGALPVSLCGAMNALTTALAVELAPIRVNAVAPGMVRTPMWDAMGDSDPQHMFD